MRYWFHRVAAVLVVLQALGACGADDSQCPAAGLELRGEPTGPVQRTEYECSGNVTAIQSCAGPLLAAATDTDCGDLQITLGDKQSGGGHVAALYVDFDGQRASRVRGQIYEITDLIDGTPQYLSNALGGWVAFEAAARDPAERTAGRFRLEFAEGVIEGAFDTSNRVVQGTFVGNAITVGATPEQAALVGLDLNGDGTTDNVLGRFFASLPFGPDGDYQQLTSQLIADGDIVPLLAAPVASKMSGSFDSRWQTFVGKPAPGTGLEINDQIPGRTVAGTTRENRFDSAVAPTTLDDAIVLQVAIFEPAAPVALALPRARVEADVASDEITVAHMGGAVAMSIVDQVLIPALATAFVAQVEEDCPLGSCSPGSSGEGLLARFDDDDDGTITADELRNSADIATALAPDLDLLGTGTLDAVSFGVDIHGSAADFVLPPPP